jgi:Ca2+-binding EF-hand superfamily protein
MDILEQLHLAHSHLVAEHPVATVVEEEDESEQPAVIAAAVPTPSDVQVAQPSALQRFRKGVQLVAAQRPQEQPPGTRETAPLKSFSAVVAAATRLGRSVLFDPPRKPLGQLALEEDQGTHWNALASDTNATPTDEAGHLQAMRRRLAGGPSTLSLTSLRRRHANDKTSEESTGVSGASAPPPPTTTMTTTTTGHASSTATPVSQPIAVDVGAVRWKQLARSIARRGETSVDAAGQPSTPTTATTATATATASTSTTSALPNPRPLTGMRGLVSRLMIDNGLGPQPASRALLRSQSRRNLRQVNELFGSTLSLDVRVDTHAQAVAAAATTVVPHLSSHMRDDALLCFHYYDALEGQRGLMVESRARRTLMDLGLYPTPEEISAAVTALPVDMKSEPLMADEETPGEMEVTLEGFLGVVASLTLAVLSAEHKQSFADLYLSFVDGQSLETPLTAHSLSQLLEELGHAVSDFELTELLAEWGALSETQGMVLAFDGFLSMMAHFFKKEELASEVEDLFQQFVSTDAVEQLASAQEYCITASDIVALYASAGLPMTMELAQEMVFDSNTSENPLGVGFHDWWDMLTTVHDSEIFADFGPCAAVACVHALHPENEGPEAAAACMAVSGAGLEKAEAANIQTKLAAERMQRKMKRPPISLQSSQETLPDGPPLRHASSLTANKSVDLQKQDSGVAVTDLPAAAVTAAGFVDSTTSRHESVV